MGTPINRKLLVIILCCLLTSIIIYWIPQAKIAKKTVSISKALSEIGEWRSNGTVPLEQEIIKELELDDYVNQSYSNGKEFVSLYIGYYVSTKKVGASHSPLVCFPGQGWVLKNKENKSFNIDGKTIHFSTMIAERGEKKELILYWFQAFDRTFPGTFLQKVYAFWARLLHSREDNAFVRVSVPIGNQTLEDPLKTGISFVKAFYPAFLDYVIENKP